MQFKTFGVALYACLALLGCDKKSEADSRAQTEGKTLSVFEDGHIHSRDTLSLNFEEPISGHNIVPVILSAEIEASGFSGSAGYKDHQVNVGFLDAQSMSTQWVFPTLSQDIVELISVPTLNYRRYDKYNERQSDDAIIGHILLVRDADVNQDGRLNFHDPYRAFIVDIDGSNLRLLMEERITNFRYTQLEGDNALIRYHVADQLRVARFNSNNLTIEAVAPLALP